MTPTSPPRRRHHRAVLAITAAVSMFLAACGAGGPDLDEVVNASSRITGTSTVAAQGIDGGVGVDGVWSADGTPTQVADSMAVDTPPDERTDDAGGDVFLLYPSGTLWVTAAAAGTAVVLYNDNDSAYSRHNGILIRNSRWGTRVNDYRSSGSGSSGSNSGNGFRGGGSSSGK